MKMAQSVENDNMDQSHEYMRKVESCKFDHGYSRDYVHGLIDHIVLHNLLNSNIYVGLLPNLTLNLF